MDQTSGSEPAPVDAHEHLTTALWRRADDPAEAMRFHDGHRWVSLSWSEVAHRVREVAAGLIALGVEPGEPVAIMSPTRSEWTIADLAILAAAAVTVPLYETDSPDRCAFVLGNTRPRTVLTGSRELAERVTGVRDDIEGLDRVLVFDDGALDEVAGHADDAAFTALDERLAALRGTDIASIVHTSGTTGPPKGCVLTHHNLVWTIRQSLHRIEAAFEGDRPSTLLILPLAHVFARIIQFACVETGALIGYARSRDQLPDDLTAVRPRFLLGVPRVFEKITEPVEEQASSPIARRAVEMAEEAAAALARDEAPGLVTRTKARIADRLVYRRVRASLSGEVRYALSGGGPLSDDVVRLLAAAGLTLVQGYGLTETSAPATVDRPESPRVGTGDLGELDGDGYLRITGRTKELLVTAGGKNVAPTPLEEALRAHPLVAEPVVIGDGRPFIAALITLDGAAAPRYAGEHGTDDPAALHQHERIHAEIGRAVEEANQRVSRAEAIGEFRILERAFSVEEDELTPTRKPRRATILEHFAEEVDDIYAARAARNG